MILFLLSACQKDHPNTLASLAGKTLSGTVTSASGIFTGLEGYQFTTQFHTNTFETHNAIGVLESAGQYDLKKNRLILQSSSGLHTKEGLEITLKFTDASSGVYEARSLSNALGEQTGIFNLR